MLLAIKGLSDKDLDLLHKHLSLREIGKSAVIFEEATTANTMYFVESGAVKTVHRSALDGRDDQVVAVCKPGGFFGEEAVLGENQRYLTTAVALEATRVLVLTQAALQDLMTESIGTGTKLLLGISRNYRESISGNEPTARTIVVTAAKAGTGATTTAVNLAVALRRRTNKRVALLDLDLQMGNAAMFLNMPPNPNIARLVQMEESLVYDRIRWFMVNACGVDSLWAAEAPQEAELITRAGVNQILQECQRHYDYVVVDLQSHIDDVTLLLWDRADTLVLVGQPDLPSLQRFRTLIKVIERLDYPREKYVTVLNRFAPEGHEFLAEYAKVLPAPQITITENAAAAREAQFHGTPFAADPAHPLAAGIHRLVDQCTGATPQTAPHAAGWFGRIKGLLGAS